MADDLRDNWLTRWADGLVSLKNASQVLSQAVRMKAGDDAAHLSHLYGHALTYRGAQRNPVVLIPGILGSKLTETATGQSMWGG
ncbi:MAG: hypothetical protein AAGK78_10015, partial [Planctomycetota bacterium]